jgi:glycosyltransferase involved in cell wall biosynthesis
VCNSAPRASILINNYNYGCYLRQCIDSACAQTYADLEIIVVDDGSTDDSISIIKSYGDRIVPILKENAGQASCFNVGFASSRGDVIFLLDSDDVFHPEKVATFMKIYDQREVQWCVDETDQSGVPQVTGSIANEKVQFADWRGSITRGAIPHVPAPTSGLSFRRDLLARILPMPTANGITLSDNYIKFAAAGLGAGAICTVPFTYQRIHASNRYTQSPQIRARRAEIMQETGEQLIRHFPFLSAIAIKLISLAIADQIAQGASRLPLLLRLWQSRSFNLAQKLQITVLSAMRAVRKRLAGG